MYTQQQVKGSSILHAHIKFMVQFPNLELIWGHKHGTGYWGQVCPTYLLAAVGSWGIRKPSLSCCCWCCSAFAPYLSSVSQLRPKSSSLGGLLLPRLQGCTRLEDGDGLCLGGLSRNNSGTFALHRFHFCKKERKKVWRGATHNAHS